MTTSTITVATEIINQLGGNHFIAMTGSYNFVYDSNSLLMHLRRNKAGATWMKITLTSMDTYTVEFIKQVKFENKTVKRIEGVYNDMLRSLFTEVTGLYTSL